MNPKESSAPEASIVPPNGSGEPTGADLPDALHGQVTDLFDEGSDFEDEGDAVSAMNAYVRALELLPTPRTQWEGATLMYAALGDTLLFLERHDEAHRAFQLALQSPKGTENGYIWLRLGDNHKASGRTGEALKAFTSAYMLEGADIFEENDEDLEWLEREGIAEKPEE